MSRADDDRRYEAKRVRAHTLLRQRHPDEWAELRLDYLRVAWLMHPGQGYHGRASWVESRAKADLKAAHAEEWRQLMGAS